MTSGEMVELANKFDVEESIEFLNIVMERVDIHDTAEAIHNVYEPEEIDELKTKLL